MMAAQLTWTLFIPVGTGRGRWGGGGLSGTTLPTDEREGVSFSCAVRLCQHIWLPKDAFHDGSVLILINT